jgi:hypothetical protein
LSRDYCLLPNLIGNDAVNLNQIEVVGGVVYAVGEDDSYFDTTTANPNSPISWDGNVFSIAVGMEYHPVAFVSWFGAKVANGS